MLGFDLSGVEITAVARYSALVTLCEYLPAASSALPISSRKLSTSA